MDALSSLVRRAEAGDPLAGALAAILNSGLIVMTRDGAGRFVQVSEVLGQRLGIGDERGAVYTREMKYYSSDGRLLPGSDTPPQRVRMSGRGRRNELNRLETSEGVIWMQQSNLPLEQTAEGWSVLTVASDVTELVEDRESARRAASVRGAIAELAMELAGRQVELEELVELLQEPAAELLPTANVVLAAQHGDQYQLTPVHHGSGERPSRHGGRITQEIREQLDSGRTLVNLDVQDTDILGARVAAEYGNPIRSMVMAASGRPDGSRLAGVVATSDRRQAFDRLEIESLELLGRLVGSVLPAEIDDAGSVARRSA